MPASSAIWTVRPTADYTTEIRNNLDTWWGTPFDYVGTIEGVWSLAAAQLAYNNDQMGQAVISCLLTATSPRELLIARIREAGSEPRPATPTRVRVYKNGIGILPIDTVVQTQSTIVPPFGNPVIDPKAQWKVVDNDSDNPADGAAIILESIVPGEVRSAQPIAIFTFVTPVPPLVNLEYDEGNGSYTVVGRPEETTPELRNRLGTERLANGGSYPAMRQRVLDLQWVVAADIKGAGGVTTVTVSPGPTGQDQRLELANTLLNVGPPGEWGGSEEETIPGPGGTPITIRWNQGNTEEVEIELSNIVVGGVPVSEVEAAVRSNIRAEFAKLSPGDPILYLYVITSTRVNGLRGITVTMNGGTADVYPSTLANTLVPVFV